jgi:hypothetical protein
MKALIYTFGSDRPVARCDIGPVFAYHYDKDSASHWKCAHGASAIEAAGFTCKMADESLSYGSVIDAHHDRPFYAIVCSQASMIFSEDKLPWPLFSSESLQVKALPIPKAAGDRVFDPNDGEWGGDGILRIWATAGEVVNILGRKRNTIVRDKPPVGYADVR